MRFGRSIVAFYWAVFGNSGGHRSGKGYTRDKHDSPAEAASVRFCRPQHYGAKGEQECFMPGLLLMCAAHVESEIERRVPALGYFACQNSKVVEGTGGGGDRPAEIITICMNV